MEILIIQTAFPGDLFLSLPLVKQTRKLYPDARISLMCRKGLGQFFLKHQLIDQLIEIQKGDRLSYRSARKLLGERKIDLLISPHRSFRTAMFIRSLKVGTSVGYKRWWNHLFFDRRLRYPTELPDALRQLKLLTLVNDEFSKKFEIHDSFLGHKDVESLNFENLKIPEWSSAQVKDWDPKGNIICVAPGSVWPTKRWLTSSYSELVGRLLKQGYEIYLVGSKADLSECDFIQSHHPEVKNFCGQTDLIELSEILRSARLLISNDSGAMHVASAVGCPSIVLFGPTVPEFGFRPWQQKVRILQTKLDCRPCSVHGTMKCPLGTHACMKKLSVDFVHQNTNEMLKAQITHPYTL